MKILVIGDSIIKCMEMHLINGLKDHDVIFRPFPGAKIEGLIDEISLIKCQLDCILVHIGTNNILRDGVGTILRKFGDLFDEITLINPEVKVIVSGILPRTQNNFLSKGERALFLKDLPKINQKISIVNNNLSFMCGGRGFSYFLSKQPILGEDQEPSVGKVKPWPSLRTLEGNPPAAKPDEALFALIALTRPWPPPFVRPPFSGTAGSPATYSVIVNASAVDSCASVAAPLYTVVQTRPWPPAFVRPPFGSLSAVQTRPWPPAFVRPPFGSLSAVQTRPLPPERSVLLPVTLSRLSPSYDNFRRLLDRSQW
ncbi:hypothetical protein JTE90_026008 [Oedothorax gibbosus]|uniref:SGNH hydrolase-type esterase domain-containing protein n=1 Tax=Oedothorax gibbosus TaxID=931172 RepID=A0AAV6UHQ0_9ARAC|nr:hypothetical protein JTE90_026008 [Oedothorax gibbosus]